MVNQYQEFNSLCKKINQEFDSRWNSDYEKLNEVNEQLKKALQGEKEAEQYFKMEIVKYLKESNPKDIEYPGYYLDLIDGIYHENWGLAGLAEWFMPKYAESSSAKVIGDRVYFLDNGVAKLMPQKIDDERRKQLVAKLLAIKPDERKDKDVNEIYLCDGTRVTIFNDTVTKAGQDVIVFRRYVVPDYTFEEQAKRGTIPTESIELFLNMIPLGYNIAITGAVRTAKSTFLATWQRYEDPKLEGLLLETDPEIPLHKLMPNAPIIQLVADEEKLKDIIKHILRSDSEYLIMGEARDGIAVDALVRIANKGTRHCKTTFHNRFPEEYPYDAASEIVRTEGGDISLIAEKVAQSIDYIFHFIQLEDKSKKRLDGIYELTCNKQTGDITTTQICKYIKGRDSWEWYYYISEEQRKAGEKENDTIFNKFEKILDKLGQQFPMEESNINVRNYRKI